MGGVRSLVFAMIIYIYILMILIYAKLCQNIPHDANRLMTQSIESRRGHNALTILAWVPGNQSSATDDRHLDVSLQCLRSSHKA